MASSVTYRYSSSFVFTPLVAFLAAVILAFSSRPPQTTSDFLLLYGCLFLIAITFVDFRFGTYIELDGTELLKVNEFVRRKRIPVAGIERIAFVNVLMAQSGPVTLVISGETDGIPFSIQMTEIAYARAPLVDLANRLTRSNPRINKDFGLLHH